MFQFRIASNLLFFIIGEIKMNKRVSYRIEIILLSLTFKLDYLDR